MRMGFRFYVLLSFGVLTFVSGCEQTQADILCYDSLDDIDVSKVAIYDKGLSLNSLGGIEYKINDFIFLSVNNNSDNYIWIPKGYLQRISRITEKDKRIEIETDDQNREAEYDIILSPKGSNDPSYDSSRVLIFYPYMQTPNESETIQVEVFGFEYRDGKICDKMYPAMIEVTLSQ